MGQTASANKGILWNIGECGKTQFWIAISVYVLVAIMKKKPKIELSLYTILQILSVTLFKKLPILQALHESYTSIIDAN